MGGQHKRARGLGRLCYNREDAELSIFFSEKFAVKSTKKPQYAKCDYGNGEGAEVAPRGHGNKIMPAEQSGLLGAQCLWAGNCSPGQLSQCRARGLGLSLCRKERFFQADRE